MQLMLYLYVRISAIEIMLRQLNRKMLAELNTLVREIVDRKLVRSIIGLKHRMGMGIDWRSQLADELHKPVRIPFQKRTVFAKQVDDIWAADLVEMTSLSRWNNGYKYVLTVIDVFSKYGWNVPLKFKAASRLRMRFANCSLMLLLVAYGRIWSLNSTTNN